MDGFGRPPRKATTHTHMHMCGRTYLVRVDLDGLAAGDAGLAHPARHHRGVGGHAALLVDGWVSRWFTCGLDPRWT